MASSCIPYFCFVLFGAQRIIQLFLHEFLIMFGCEVCTYVFKTTLDNFPLRQQMQESKELLYNLPSIHADNKHYDKTAINCLRSLLFKRKERRRGRIGVCLFLGQFVTGICKIVVELSLIQGLLERSHRGTNLRHTAKMGVGQIVYLGTS